VDARIEERLRRASRAALSWDPNTGGRWCLIRFNDSLQEDLGEDPTGERFEAISHRMLNGRYYPPDVLTFYGRYMEDHREIRAGDRLLQRARLIPLWPKPELWSAVEILVAEKTEDGCKVGYLTTEQHFARGMWTADLRRLGTRLVLQVRSIACPKHWLFWIGLPYARFLQLRARRRAIEEFRKL